MNDSFYELLVTRKKTGRDAFVFILSIAVIVLALMSSMILGPFGMLIAVVFGVMAYFFVWSKKDVEYEYSLLNHDFEIDIIYNQSKRKKITTLDLTQAELIAPWRSHKMDSYRKISAADYSSGTEGDDVYAIIISQNQSLQCILVELDQVMKDHLSAFLPRTFSRD